MKQVAEMEKKRPGSGGPTRSMIENDLSALRISVIQDFGLKEEGFTHKPREPHVTGGGYMVDIPDPYAWDVRLDKGNIVVGEGENGRDFVITPSGRINIVDKQN